LGSAVSFLTSNLLLLSSNFFVLTSRVLAQQPPSPIIVDIGETKKSEVEGLSDVLIGALGLTGLLMLGAIIAAAAFAGVLFWIRSRSD
jgi:hypothetical protein